MTHAAFHPLRIVLRATHDVRLGHHHAATICQLAKEAGTRIGFAGMPPNLTTDAVEVGRWTIDKDESYAFGWTIWDSPHHCCRELFERMVDAVRKIGCDGEARRNGLGGNFQIHECHSLVDPDAATPVAIPQDWIERQIEAAAEHETLTLRWVSPLRATLPSRLRSSQKRHQFFDTHVFPLADLADRLVRRLRETIGITSLDNQPVLERDIQVVDPPGLSRLHWIKWQYGKIERGANHKGKPRRKKQSGRRDSDLLSGQLYGVMGRLVVRVNRKSLLPALVLGQYSLVGERTTFGQGRYVIEETQHCLPDHVPLHLRAARAMELADLALRSPAVQQEANRLNVSATDLRKVAKAIQAGTFEPRPAERFLLPGDKPRLISVPSRPERVAQRAVYELLYPTLDRFLSDSCYAYRRGLGRHNAAARITESFQEGWRWALKADFHHFFDSVDHRVLQDKLEVFVQDDALVRLLMQWVAGGSPFSGRGLPTGAVISPLLANLFLQPFDEAVRQDGGRLVRYGDDFVLLFRDPAKGRAVLERAGQLARQLQLHLNDDKTKLVQLQNTPFDFLGYRFFAEKGWQFHGDGLTQIEDLHWHEAPKARDVGTQHVLVGEQGLEQSRSGTWIVGPRVDWVGIDGADVVCRGNSQGTEDRFQRRRVGELIVLGPATLDHSLFRQREETPLQILVADDVGRWTCAIADALPLESAELVLAQVALASDNSRRLAIAQRLVAAKLRNHATLASAYPARKSPNQLGQRLRELAQAALQAGDLPELLGIEGAGAAAWYGEFERRINRRYQFERRVHPRASDPVNIMLNVTQTLLHRIIGLSLIREGFAPSIGILHRPSAGHAALASDIQEVFRHLMDRVVIETTDTISPGEFHPTGSGPFDMRMEAGAYRTLVAAAMKMLATTCVMKTQQAARPYRQHIATFARSLRAHLLNPDAPLKIFEHLT
jgi:CRISPR-associated protein Cas1